MANTTPNDEPVENIREVAIDGLHWIGELEDALTALGAHDPQVERLRDSLHFIVESVEEYEAEGGDDDDEFEEED